MPRYLDERRRVKITLLQLCGKIKRDIEMKPDTKRELEITLLVLLKWSIAVIAVYLLTEYIKHL